METDTTNPQTGAESDVSNNADVQGPASSDSGERANVVERVEDQPQKQTRTPLRRGASNSSLADRDGFRARLASVTYSLSEVDLLADDVSDIVDGDVTTEGNPLDSYDDGIDDAALSAEMEDKEIEDFYMKLTYYIASEPSGDLNTQDAMDLLNFFTLLQPMEHRQYLDIGAVQAVFNVMERGSEIPQIQVSACYALRALAATPPGEELLLQNGVLAELMMSSEGFPDVVELQTIVLVIFAELACSELGRTAMFDARCHTTILTILTSLARTDTDARRWACAAVAFLAENNPAGQDVLIRAGAMAALVACITPPETTPDNHGEVGNDGDDAGNQGEHSDDVGGENASGDVAQLALLGMKNLLAHPSARAKFLDGNKTGLLPTTDLKAVVQCMRSHLSVAGVQEHGCALLQQLLAKQPDSDAEQHSAMCTILRNSGVVELLHDVAAAHPDAVALQAAVESLLMQLSSGYTGYAYHFVKATLANFSLWRQGKKSDAVDAPDVA
eukprot:m.286854 g.286854  ORF g.286854 m.286854 type:complete len:501 (+) comp19938_c0_seq2:191-1693(+)